MPDVTSFMASSYSAPAVALGQISPALSSGAARHSVEWRQLLLLALAAAMVRVAAIPGIVVENQTGRPLERTLVVASPISGTAGGAKSARTNTYGAFSFDDLPAGAFLVSAARKGFAGIQYGRSLRNPVVLLGAPVIHIEQAARSRNLATSLHFKNST